MGGIIECQPAGVWHAANWVYEHILELLLEDLKGHYLEALLRTPPGLNYLDLSEFSEQGLLDMKDALARVKQRVADGGPSTFDSPEFFAGFSNKLEGLCSIVEAASNKRSHRTP